MTESNSPWKRVRDKEKWAARGASLVAKAKATKVVWFPPKPVETGKKAASTTKRATKGAAKTATKGASKGTTRAAKKTAASTKKVTDPVRRKKA